jgi:hypothetical protein
MFENYPRIKYDFINENGEFSSPEVVDIFRSVVLSQKTLNNPSNFNYHAIDEGDTPERIAAEIYNDSFLWWVVLLTNGIIDKEREWPKNSAEINRIFDEFLDGNSYFIMENVNIKKDDVIIKRSADGVGCDPALSGCSGSVNIDVFGVVNNYDSHLHKIDVKTKRSVGTFEENDEFYIVRRKHRCLTNADVLCSSDSDENFHVISGFGGTACARQTLGSTSCSEIFGPTSGDAQDCSVFPCRTLSFAQGPYCATAGSTFGIIRKKSTLKNSLKYFEFKGDYVDPYAVPNSMGGATGSYYMGGDQNICGLTGTVLYKYIFGTLQSEYPEIKAIAEGADIIRKNDKRRMIKTLTPFIAKKVVQEFQSLISGTLPPGTTKYIDYST